MREERKALKVTSQHWLKERKQNECGGRMGENGRNMQLITDK